MTVTITVTNTFAKSLAMITACGGLHKKVGRGITGEFTY